MKRASYRAGIAWIASNEETGNEAEFFDAQTIAYYISSVLLADLFGVDPERVGADVVAYRRKHGGEAQS